MKLKSRKMNKLGIISMILVAAMLLPVPVLATSGSDTSDATESSSDNTDSGSTDSGSTDSGKSDSEGKTDSKDSATESLSADDDSDGADVSSGSGDTISDPVATITETAGGTPEKVDLGTAESFAILAYSGVTVAGAEDSTTIHGDIGVFPNDAYTGEENVDHTDGAVYLADAGGVAAGAQDDLLKAYNDAKDRDSTRDITDSDLGDLSTEADPLLPGVYTASSSLGLTGDLYLYADNPYDAFIFQIGTTLITASYSNIFLQGLATFCQVFWQVGTSATLGSDSYFEGHIMANDSISVGTGTTVLGQLLALNGAVTLEGSNTIENVPCTADVSDSDIDDPAVGVPDGTGFTSPGVKQLGTGTESVLDTDTDSEVSSDEVALPATGGYPIAQALSVMGMALLAAGGVLLKKKLI